MRIIVSPAKTMADHAGGTEADSLPTYIDRAEEILAHMKHLSEEDLKALWKCSDKIVAQNMVRIAEMDLRTQRIPAVMAFEGSVFRHMTPADAGASYFDYLQEHLRILSAFYGVLRAMDGVRAYRLDMANKLSVNGYANLYDFWGRQLYDAVRDPSGVIINLASKEYSKCIEKYLTPDDRYITITFCEESGGKLVTKGTYAKMARGEMVRYMAEHAIADPEDIKGFNRMGFAFREDLSTDGEYIFERIPEDR